MGRPSKYTPKAVATIVEMIEKGASKVKAAEAAGITYTTFWEWTEKYPEFSNAVKKADEVYLENMRTECLGIILEAAKDRSWQAGAWLLERNFEQYKVRTDTTIKHSGEIKIPKLRWADEE